MPGHRYRGGPGSGRGKNKKLIDYSVWLSGIGRNSCRECQATYAGRHQKRPWHKKIQGKIVAPPQPVAPPCERCRPELLPDNAEAVRLYEQCGDQWRYCRETGRLVIDNSNILAAMQAMQVMDGDGAAQQETFAAVKLIIGEIASAYIKQAEQQEGGNGAIKDRPGRR